MSIICAVRDGECQIKKKSEKAILYACSFHFVEGKSIHIGRSDTNCKGEKMVKMDSQATFPYAEIQKEALLQQGSLFLYLLLMSDHNLMRKTRLIA